MTNADPIIQHAHRNLTRAQIREKCRAFRDRGLTYADVSERMLELYGVTISERMVNHFCVGSR